MASDCTVGQMLRESIKLYRILVQEMKNGCGGNIVMGTFAFKDLSDRQQKKVGGICRKMTISTGNKLSKVGEPRNTISLSLKADLEMLFTAASE
ncbi:MAG: hypothetical protein WAV05_16855 [Anaerolineales bacterium]